MLVKGATGFLIKGLQPINTVLIRTNKIWYNGLLILNIFLIRISWRIVVCLDVIWNVKWWFNRIMIRKYTTGPVDLNMVFIWRTSLQLPSFISRAKILYVFLSKILEVYWMCNCTFAGNVFRYTQSVHHWKWYFYDHSKLYWKTDLFNVVWTAFGKM